LIRDYLANPRLWWEPRTQRIIVEVEVSATPQEARLAVHDDLLETVVATVAGDWDRVRIEFLHARPVG
jgi:hypothetical protein